MYTFHCVIVSKDLKFAKQKHKHTQIKGVSLVTSNFFETEDIYFA